MLNFLRQHYHKNYHGVYQHAKKLFVFDLALFLSAIFMLMTSIFLFLWKPGLNGFIDISISLGNERVKSGEEIHLTIDYTNKSKFKLTNTVLALHLPHGFIVDKTKTPSNIFSDDLTFALPQEIQAGATGQAEIYGWFWSEPNKEIEFISNLSYQPENSSKREQKLSSFVARLTESVLTGELDMATSTLASYPLDFTYTLKNSSDREITNIYLSNNWNVGAINEKDATNISLSPGETKIIKGRLQTPNKSGDFSFSITPQVLINNRLVSQTPATQNIYVFSPQIISSAQLLKNIPYVEPGQIIPIEIKWENKNAFKLKNMTLHLTANLQGVVDWKKTTQENGAWGEKNGLFFDNKNRTGLSDGNLNGSDTFNLNIYLLPNFDWPQIDQTYLEIYPIMRADVAQTPDQKFSQEGNRIKIPLTTKVDFGQIEARYYTSDGDQLGRGPLPPQVGKTTKYWIFIKIINTTNAVFNPIFNTSLPEGVEFTGKQSTSIGPQLAYNSVSRAISWKYSSLPANSQTGLYFEVSVTPTVSQIGQNILLTNLLQFSAIDNFTNKKFDLSHPALTNILNTDDSGYRLGSKVRE